MDSCFNESNLFVFARLCLGVVLQFLCSYVTLPLYALVSQVRCYIYLAITSMQQA
jgi:mlo protein